MPVPTIPSAISASSIQTEFGGSNPISLSEYYAGGVNVPAGTANATSVLIPSSGTLRFSNFSGAQKIASSTTSFTIGAGTFSPGFSTFLGYYGAPYNAGSMNTSTIGGRTILGLFDWYIFGGHQSVVLRFQGDQRGTWFNTITWTHGSTGYSVTVNRTDNSDPANWTGDYDGTFTSFYMLGKTLLMRSSTQVAPAGETGTIVISA